MPAEARLNLAMVAAALVFLTAGCSSSVTHVLGCIPSQGITPICEFHNPEDMAATPSGEWLLVSEAGAADASSQGSLVGYQPASGRVEVLFPVGEFDDVRDWGDPACRPPSDVVFSPHGIDLQVRRDGALELLAVNHGSREAQGASVEFFAVEENDVGLALYWRGCVLAPEHAFFNDVLVRDAGGFWVTDTMPNDHPLWAALTGLFGADTGRVYRWTAAEGFVAVAGSDMPFPYGIEKSRSEDALFVASFLGDEVRKVDLNSGAVVGRAPIRRPDHLTWDADGKLVVPSHTEVFTEMLACRDLDAGACGSAFEVVQLDPESMQILVLLAHRGAPLGAVSVALQLGDEVYLGSGTSDRIARWRIHPRENAGSVPLG